MANSFYPTQQPNQGYVKWHPVAKQAFNQGVRDLRGVATLAGIETEEAFRYFKSEERMPKHVRHVLELAIMILRRGDEWELKEILWERLYPGFIDSLKRIGLVPR